MTHPGGMGRDPATAWARPELVGLGAGVEGADLLHGVLQGLRGGEQMAADGMGRLLIPPQPLAERKRTCTFGARRARGGGTMGGLARLLSIPSACP